MTMKQDAQVKKTLPRKNVMVLAMIAWVLVMVGSLAWEWYHSAHAYQDLALAEARLFFQKDLTFRKWVAMHGGVYVPPTDNTPPNPYLADIPDRDVMTTSGKQLTLINPAYMTRQLHELGEKDFGLRGHITSLTPIRPENAPDAWETDALQAFEDGAAEVVSEEVIDGLPYYRAMWPLVTKASCLKCHGRQGYKEGDIRGGLSVAVPLSGYFAAVDRQHAAQLLVHLLVGGLGLLGFWGGNFYLRRAERSLVDTEWYFRSLIHSIREDILVIDQDYCITDVNDAALSSMGQTRQSVIGQCCYEITHGLSEPCDQHGLSCPLSSVFADGESVNCLHEHVHADGSTVHVDLLASPIRDEGGVITHVIEVSRDVTELLTVQKERENLQDQLQQAQKMEAIGRLAGGVAHDYNNMLGVILGYTQMAQDAIEPDQPLYADLEEIRKAAMGATSLTRQLLAFARKESIDPLVLDLNECVSGMHKMLGRLISENISLVWQPDTQGYPVCMDPTQINQILANLCINARDAISGTGTITIETGTETLTDADVQRDGELPGEYVLLSVRDDGFGMTPEVMEKLFDPFFTTKEQGKGTGLGLATVYSIAKQNQGFIRVFSEPGHGSLFQVWLPRHEEKGSPAKEEVSEQPLLMGDETILLVDDECTVLETTKRMLERLGYRVLAFASPTEALDLAKDYPGMIHLLITDVVMPEMNGKELAAELTPHISGLKILYISGYISNELDDLDFEEVEHSFLQKPFAKHSLAAKVRTILDPPSEEQVIAEKKFASPTTVLVTA